MKNRGEQEVRAEKAKRRRVEGNRSQSSRMCKEKKSRGEQEVRAENAKRRRVEGNKKSEQGIQREEE